MACHDDGGTAVQGNGHPARYAGDQGSRSPSIPRAGRVPVLYHGKLVIWDSMAILEYLAETFPEKKLWPVGKTARAVARSVANEMHSGFAALRNACPMNIRRAAEARCLCQMRSTRTSPASNRSGASAANTSARADHSCSESSRSPMPCIAPVASRFSTYELATADDRQGLCGDDPRHARLQGCGKEAALQETWIIPADEVD